ncbi:hypothetical protein [Deinococcus alpinitundrae]|uniref:hypothetical protein n=1 Tax=Deinococcus alpinitundrae TaxID=468913 RepID=UPI00137B18F4|nr:hypothetical protein [Deinococcus alpinitundrae]
MALRPDELLADLLSRDPVQVWASACAVIQLDDLALIELVRHLPEIERGTADLDLGGAFFPNREHLQQALRVLRARRDGRCSCSVYPGYLFYDPEKEAQAKRIRILSHTPPDWTMTYRCRCAVCGSDYDVEQGESHYTWWQWRPA